MATIINAEKARELATAKWDVIYDKIADELQTQIFRGRLNGYIHIDNNIPRKAYEQAAKTMSILGYKCELHPSALSFSWE